MKKLLSVVLVGVFSLGAMSLFAQTKPETIQERLLRLEAENAALRAQVVKSQAQSNTPKTALTNTLKPYYANMEVQQLCEEFDAIEGLGPDQDFKIDTYMKKQHLKDQDKEVAQAEMQIFSSTSGVFTGTRPRTVYKITLTIMKRGGRIAHIKTYKKWVYNNSDRK